MSLQKDVNVVRRYIKNKYGKIATVYIHKPKKDDSLLDHIVTSAIKIIRKVHPGSVPRKSLANSSRKREVVALKQALMYILRTELNYTSCAIAKATGMNHATVLYGEKNSKNMIETGDKLFMESYELIKWRPLQCMSINVFIVPRKICHLRWLPLNSVNSKSPSLDIWVCEKFWK